MNHILSYLEAIERGEIVASQKVTKAYQLLRADLEAGRYVYDDRKAQKVIAFTERFLHHSKGKWAGQRVRLELWQKAMLAAVFGVIDPSTGHRRFTEVFFVCGRKNGKSFIAAALSVWMMLEEAGAECYITSTKHDQSQHTYEEILAMVEQSPSLRRRTRRRRTDLVCTSNRGIIKPLGSRSSSMDGLNASLVIADELHAWQGERGRRLYEVMHQAQSSREQPLFVTTTTAGFDRMGVYDDLYELSSRILSGEVHAPQFLPLIYELDEADEWTDPAMWVKANPNLGISKRVADLEAKVSRASAMPVELPGLLCKDFCVRQSGMSTWLSYQDIHNDESFVVADLRGSWGIGGCDLSMSGDLTAACVIVPHEGKVCVLSHFWIPEDTVEEHEQKDGVPYTIWRNQGHVSFSHGNQVDLHQVTEWFLHVVRDLGVSLRWVGFDPWSSRYWSCEMESLGFDLVKVIQGARTLSNPMKDLGQALKAKSVLYGNPCLEWCMTNTVALVDRNENIVPTKERPAQRIDGTMALLDAWTVYLDHRDEFLALT